MFKEGIPTPDTFDDTQQVPEQPAVYYFASPYTAKTTLLKEERYLKAVLAAAELGEQGYCLIEPIGMSHHSAKVASLPTGYDYWKRRDRAFIAHSDGVIVLMIDGWLESVGVSDEIAYAFEIGKPVFMYYTAFDGHHNKLCELDKDRYFRSKAKSPRQGETITP